LATGAVSSSINPWRVSAEVGIDDGGGEGHHVGMDGELRDWLRGLSEPRSGHDTVDHPDELSPEGADYLARLARDGTLKAAFAELTLGDEAHRR
jgi:hypothetical protein